jgi:hypothetical protein
MKAFKTVVVSAGAIAALLMVAWPASASHPECPDASCNHADHPLDFELSADKVRNPDTPLGAHVAYRGANLAGPGHEYADGSVRFARTNAIRCEQWVSDEAAVFALSIPLQDVEAELLFVYPNDIAQVTLRVGKFDGAFIWGGASGLLVSEIDHVTREDTDGNLVPDQQRWAFVGPHVVPYPGQDFAVGDKIAFEVCVDTVVLDSAIMLTDDDDSTANFLDSPDPPWPTPELGTIALSAVGLAGIGGIGLVTRNVRRRD